jgi:hypothetical protein
MSTLLTAGCSFTKDNYQKTWAEYLASGLQATLTNVAARGAGIDFITTRLIYQCTKNNYDLVVIMLPSLDRIDLYVNNDHLLKDHYRDISSWQNGVCAEFVQINGEFSNDEGYSLTGGATRGYKKYWYKYYYSEAATLISYWSKVYLLENFFKNQNINYKFTMAYNKDSLVEQASNVQGNNHQHSFLHEKIDWNNFIFHNDSEGFLSFCKQFDYPVINNHPVTQAHEDWTNTVLLPVLHK